MGYRVLRAPKVTLDLQVPKAIQDPLDLRVPKVIRVFKGIQVPKVILDSSDPQDQPDHD